jgi:ankyrin repeat protein
MLFLYVSVLLSLSRCYHSNPENELYFPNLQKETISHARAPSFDSLNRAYQKSLLAESVGTKSDEDLKSPEGFHRALLETSKGDSSLARKIETGLHPDDLNSYRDAKGDTYLMIAIQKNLFELTMELLYLGANPRIANQRGWNAIHAAAAEMDPIFLKSVLSVVFNTDPALKARNKDRNSPLLVAALNGYELNVRILLEFSHPNLGLIDLQGHKGYSALIVAVKMENQKMIKYLLNFNASVVERDNSGRSAITHALNLETPEVIRMFFNHSDDTIVMIQHEARAMAALSKAIFNNCSTWIGYFHYDLGLDINRPESISDSDNPCPPLTRAARLGRSRIVTFLLILGANPNVFDLFGYTPLMYAVQNRNTEIPNSLLNYGADLHLQNPFNRKTAFSIAEEYHVAGSL